MTQDVAAPWQAWTGALAVAAAAIAATWLAATSLGPPAPELYVRFNSERIERFRAAAPPGGAVTVLMIGSSVLKYATRGEGEFAAAVSAAVGRPVRVLRVVSNGGSFSNLVPLQDALKSMNVDLLVMQRDQLASDLPRWRAFDLWLERVRLQAGVTPPDAEWTLEDESVVQFGYPCWNRTISRGLEDHVKRNEGLIAVRPDGPSARAARSLVESVLGSGGRVALVDLPRRPDYDAVALGNRDAAMKFPELEQLVRRAAYWEHGTLDARYFCDVTHVTPDGQRVYSTWLESRVAAELSRLGG